MTAVLVVNAGSTSLKLALAAPDDTIEPVDSFAGVNADSIAAVAHRVVHGGARFRDAVVLDAAVLKEIADLNPLAPLHNARALAGIASARRAIPNVPHVAVFDTAFHATMPAEATTYALPRRWREEWGVRRYGFHGLSVAWSAERAPELLGRPATGVRLVVCHLGGGSSVTSVRNGRSVDTSMGFSPLEGVPMTTRAGSVDPGALLYVMRTHGVGLDELDGALNRESGLKGLSGCEGMAEVEQAVLAGSADAQLALTLYVHRLAGTVAAMAAAAGGLDALVFTAGIGENSARVRALVCARLAFLGVELDPSRNDGAEPDCDVATPGSRVRILVLKSREEVVAARAARRILAID
jgi:acetate kinase